MRIEKHFAFLEMALVNAKLSTCIRRGYGSVLVKDGLVVSMGYNGSASGQEHCCDTKVCWRELNNIPSGERYEECVSVHSEQNALYHASWEQKQGATLYLAGIDIGTGKIITARPCKICDKHIRNNGISQVICMNEDETFNVIHYNDLTNKP